MVDNAHHGFFDKLGAITKSTRTVDSVNYTIETTYDALGRTYQPEIS